MKAKFFFIAIFAAADAFLGAFAVGFNSRHALIGDPTIPAPKIEKVAPAPTVPAAAKTSDKKDAARADDKSKDPKAKAATPKKGGEPHSATSKGKHKVAESKASKAKPKAVKANTSVKDKASTKHDTKTNKP